MNREPDHRLDVIEAEAADWLARRDRGFTAEESAAFARWRALDPQHEIATRDLEAVWGALDELTELREAEEELVPEPELAVRRTLDRWWPTLAMAAVLTILLAVTVWRPGAEAPQRYVTEIGAQQKVGLSDGSELWLNTNSAVEVRYAAHERRIKLERGEAFFRVAKDPSRPFVVVARGTEALALGTVFLLRQRAPETELVVSEGSVRFGPEGGERTTVNAQERAVFVPASGVAPLVTKMDEAALARSLAWQSGRIEFKDARLIEVVAEFNRYHREQLVLADEETGAVLVGGPFAIDNLEGFVRLLESSFDVIAQRRDATTILLTLKR